MKKAKRELCDKQIDRILREFDFAYVHQVMEAIAWKWFNGIRDEVPSISALRDAADSLLSSAIEVKGYASSGGFTAHYASGRDKDSFGKKYVHLHLFWGVDSQMLEMDDIAYLPGKCEM